PEEKVPIHEKHGVRDWDDPQGAIEWDRMADELLYVKANGRTSDSHYSHDHLNVQKLVEVDSVVAEEWKKKFSDIHARFAQQGEDVVWVVVEGFLLYWDPRIYNWFNVRAFLRVPELIARERREERQGYFITVINLHLRSLLPEGNYWKDPPFYWQDIVWPAYKKAHDGLFVNGDAEDGTIVSDKIPDLLVLEGTEMTMTELLDNMCQRVAEVAQKDLTAS
ncbi:ribosylnicotinamide kinase, partial [Tulasnella sp. 408]